MNRYLYILKLLPEYQNDQWDSKTEKLVSTHFNYLKELNEKGIVQFAGKTILARSDSQNFGLVLLKAENDQKANQIMENDPAVKHKLMTASLFPFGIALGQP